MRYPFRVFNVEIRGTKGSTENPNNVYIAITIQ